MKYAQAVFGLLVGTALGGSVVASTGLGGTGATDKEAIRKVVREVIQQEPQLILESVDKYQNEQQRKQTSGAVEKLQDPEIRKALYENKDNADVGPKDTKKTIVEFFDYNCPVCKMQFKWLDAMHKEDSSIRMIFIEFPIFGPVSDQNSKLGLAVHRLYPDKYFTFHEKMMSVPGHGPGNNEPTYKFIKELGMDLEKVKAEAAKPEVAEIITFNRELGQKLQVRGTPMLIVGDDIIPHAAEADELKARLADIK